MDTKGTSPFRKGADAGLMLGLLMTAAFFAALYSLNVPLLVVAAIACAVAVPVVVYRVLRSRYVSMRGMATFSAMWMDGIVAFFCGSLILALAVFVFLRWIEPAFVVDRLEELSAMYREAGDADSVALADMFDTVVRGKIVPSAIEIAIELIWVSVFTGSVLSMLLAGIIRLMKVKK